MCRYTLACHSFISLILLISQSSGPPKKASEGTETRFASDSSAVFLLSSASSTSATASSSSPPSSSCWHPQPYRFSCLFLVIASLFFGCLSRKILAIRTVHSLIVSNMGHARKLHRHLLRHHCRQKHLL